LLSYFPVLPNGKTALAALLCGLGLLLSNTSTLAATPSKPWTERIRLGGLFYFSYQHGESGGENFSEWRIKRGHLDVRASVLPYLEGRFTTDVKHDPDDDLTVRVKYAFARFTLGRAGFLRKTFLEVGQVRRPWIFFEESFYRYRLQDGTFMDRQGLTTSADRGVTYGGLLGRTLPDRVRERLGSHHRGRWGSFAFGVYDGGGFKESEANTNKVVSARVTVRPLPQWLPGVRLSSLTSRGRGNTEEAPRWALDALMLSWESKRFIVTAQTLDRRGNPAGTATTDAGESLHGEGWSLFGELKLTEEWSLIGRSDAFDPDRRQPGDTRRRTIAGIARHMGNRNMVLLDWERQTVASRPRDDERLQATLQMAF
jgi:hypothetical protein